MNIKNFFKYRFTRRYCPKCGILMQRQKANGSDGKIRIILQCPQCYSFIYNE